MLRHIVLAVSVLALAGCGSSQATKPKYHSTALKKWKHEQRSVDPVPRDCTRRTGNMPTPPKGEVRAKQSAREYQKLKSYTVDELQSANRCRIWARKQR